MRIEEIRESLANGSFNSLEKKIEVYIKDGQYRRYVEMCLNVDKMINPQKGGQ